MMDPVFASLYAFGERMLEALQRDDLNAFYALLDEREALVRRLSAGELQVSEGVDRTALQEQYEKILAHLARQEEQLAGALQEVRRLREAQQAYQHARHRMRNILNPNLRG